MNGQAEKTGTTSAHSSNQTTDAQRPDDSSKISEALQRSRLAANSCPVGAHLTSIWPSDEGRFGPGSLEQGCVVSAHQPPYRQGPWLVFYDTGQVRATATYEDGKLHGEFHEFHRNSKPLASGRYDSGKRVGEWRWWANDGTELRSVVFVEGREPVSIECPTTTKEETVPEEGRILRFCRDNGGMKNGPFVAVYSSGLRKEQGRYSADRRVDAWLKWGESGLPESTCEYRQGSLSGKCITFGPSGRKQAEGVYVDGRKDGLWRQWSDDGIVLVEGHYSQGVPTGAHYHYTPLGSLEFIETFDGGKLQFYTQACDVWKSKVPEALRPLEYGLNRMKINSDELPAILKQIEAQLDPPVVSTYEISVSRAKEGDLVVRATGKQGTQVVGDSWSASNGNVKHEREQCVDLTSFSH